MNNSALQKGLIINGTDSIAVAKIEDAVYRLQPIPDVTPIVFEQFKKDKPKLFKLDTELTHSYQMIDMVADITFDDDKSLGTSGSNQPSYATRVEIRIFRDGRAIQSHYLNMATYPSNFGTLLLIPGDIWEVKCRHNVNKITLNCVPIITNKPITFSGVETVVDDDGNIVNGF